MNPNTPQQVVNVKAVIAVKAVNKNYKNQTEFTQSDNYNKYTTKNTGKKKITQIIP